jgi:hypothetical protein
MCTLAALLAAASALLACAAAASAAPPPCASDADCSFNGVCAAGACACDPGWTSGVDGILGVSALPYCSFLDFAPSPVSACGPACAFHGGPSSVDTSWSSWGVSVIQVGDTFHGYAAEMANECTLSAWTRGSQVVHVSAATPLGPFVRSPSASVVVPPWSHNPQVIAADGQFVIFTLGDGWAQNGPPLNCSTADSRPPWESRGEARALVGNCTPVAEPSNCVPGPCLSCNITLHVSATPDGAGPWTPVPSQIIGLSANDTINNCALAAQPRFRNSPRALTPSAPSSREPRAPGAPKRLRRGYDSHGRQWRVERFGDCRRRVVARALLRDGARQRDK